MDIKLIHGDCLEIMQEIPSKSVDLILCDLPYQITKCAWDNKIPLDKLWREYKRIIKINGAILLFGNQPFTTDLINSNRKDYKYNIIWEKNIGGNFLNSKNQPMRFYEEISVFYSKQPTYNNINAIDKPWKRKKPQDMNTYGNINKTEFIGLHGCNRNIIKFNTLTGSDKKRLHPTQKPVDLLEYLIKIYTNEGETVLDNCMGSGSTGVACVNTNRNFIGIELDEGYFNIAKKRIEEAQKIAEQIKII